MCEANALSYGHPAIETVLTGLLLKGPEELYTHTMRHDLWLELDCSGLTVVSICAPRPWGFQF